jgi:predicted 3-demethylubiquinone-9 3-methyltransferase (glyoxalase superfamily)
MAIQIHPCLWFDGQAREAATFYCSIFKNSTIITDTPMVVIFELNGKKMMGLNGGPRFKMNPSVSMFIHCTSADECKRIWSALSEKAEVLMAMGAYPWSEQYGWLRDQFGFTWQIMKSDTDRMCPALLFTGKQTGKAPEALDFYTGVFPDSGITMKSYYPDDSPFAGNISYSEFHLGHYQLIAMDGPNEHNFTFSEGVSLVINCSTQEEIDHYWDNFTTHGGEESRCGWCKDRFGLSWQVIPDNIGKLMAEPEKAARVMQAVLKMNKMDIETLVNA